MNYYSKSTKKQKTSVKSEDGYLDLNVSDNLYIFVTKKPDASKNILNEKLTQTKNIIDQQQTSCTGKKYKKR